MTTRSVLLCAPLLILFSIVRAQDYVTALTQYEAGEKNYTAMPLLIDQLVKSKKDSIAHVIAQDYFENYLFRLPEDSVFTEDHLTLIRNLTKHSSDTSFRFLYNNTRKIDRKVGEPAFAEAMIDYIIAVEDIDAVLWPSVGASPEAPDWESMKTSIAHKYNREYADRTVLGAQIHWYKHKKDKPKLAKYLAQDIMINPWATTPGPPAGDTNNNIYYFIFKYIDDKTVLSKAAGIMKKLIDQEPTAANFMDTYANVLYKLGQTKKALRWEAKAYALDPKNTETKEAYEKMKKGLPTW